MQPAVLIRLRPAGPWRYGPGDGGLDRVDTLYRSDRLYSAVTLAMKQMGILDEWLDATARHTMPAVAFTSLFPFQGETLFIPPPATLWPPPSSLVSTPSPVFLSKVRWNAARFVPISLIESVLLGQKVLADQWAPDADSACLLRRDRPSTPPFHVVVRSAAAVDRISHNTIDVHTAACVEFESGAGLWTLMRYHDKAAEALWGERVKAAFRLLSDTGFGGRRSSGWGQAASPEFQHGLWPGLLFPRLGRYLGPSNGASSLYWMLSLYSPSPADLIEWQGGDYQTTVRGGYVDNPAVSASKKKLTRMVAEGSVLQAASEPVGSAVDVAPDGFPHPVYRSGFALALRLPTANINSDRLTPDDLLSDDLTSEDEGSFDKEIVEMPTDPEALEPRPGLQEGSEPEATPAVESRPELEPEPEAQATDQEPDQEATHEL